MSFVGTTWHHIRRSPYQTILAITVTSLTFFIVSLVVYTALVSSSLLSYFEQKPQIIAFFSDEKTDESIDILQNRFRNTDKVLSLRFVSKEEALRIYQQQNKADPLLLEMVTADILPASLEIQARDPRFLSDIADILNQEEGIDEVIYQKDIIDTLLSWTVTIRSAGISLIAFFSALTVLVSLTIIGMKIVLRRKEIEILKLVGATRFYISAPFILEGVLYGISGAIFGWLLSWAILLYSTPFLSALFQGIPSLALPFLSHLTFFSSLTIWPVNWQLMVLILLFLTFSGVVLGVLGSIIALWRYVRF